MSYDYHDTTDITDAKPGTAFDAWKALVDKELRSICGMISDDLPDVDYYGLFTTGNSPAEAAEYAIQYAMEN